MFPTKRLIPKSLTVGHWPHTSGMAPSQDASGPSGHYCLRVSVGGCNSGHRIYLKNEPLEPKSKNPVAHRCWSGCGWNSPNTFWYFWCTTYMWWCKMSMPTPSWPPLMPWDALLQLLSFRHRFVKTFVFAPFDRLKGKMTIYRDSHAKRQVVRINASSCVHCEAHAWIKRQDYDRMHRTSQSPRVSTVCPLPRAGVLIMSACNLRRIITRQWIHVIYAAVGLCHMPRLHLLTTKDVLLFQAGIKCSLEKKFFRKQKTLNFGQYLVWGVLQEVWESPPMLLSRLIKPPCCLTALPPSTLSASQSSHRTDNPSVHLHPRYTPED